MEPITTKIEIKKFEACYAAAFRALNEAWIAAHFEMEPGDYIVLDHPVESILTKGGEIFVAVTGTTVLGVCAVICTGRPGRDYELAKMALSPESQGKDVGFMLGTAVIRWARGKGGQTLFLDSNTKLEAAIHLYHKLGFRKVSNFESPYQRTDIQMVLDLNTL